MINLMSGPYLRVEKVHMDYVALFFRNFVFDPLLTFSLVYSSTMEGADLQLAVAQLAARYVRHVHEYFACKYSYHIKGTRP